MYSCKPDKVVIFSISDTYNALQNALLSARYSMTNFHPVMRSRCPLKTGSDQLKPISQISQKSCDQIMQYVAQSLNSGLKKL